MEITKDTRALVTGANGGLGSAIARALHAAGATMVVTGRRAEALRPLADTLGARVIVADLATRADVARCMDEAGPVDVLVANAALPSSGPLMEFEADQIDRALDVNLRAPIMMAHRAVVGMLERGRGHIVFISSISGKVAARGPASTRRRSSACVASRSASARICTDAVSASARSSPGSSGTPACSRIPR